MNRLLEEYERHRDVTLADLVERAEAARDRPRLELPLKKGAAATHLASLLSPETTPALERGPVLAALERFGREAPGAVLTPLILQLAMLPPDPRVAALLLRLLTVDHAVREVTDKLFRALLSALAHHGHPGQAAALNTFADRYTLSTEPGPDASEEALTAYANRPLPDPDERWRWRGSRRVRALAAKLAALRPTPDPALLRDARAQLGAAPVVPGPSTVPQHAELLAAIAATPDDDAPRLVLADLLSEHGDPRGELIALQVKRALGESSKAGVAREKALLAEHRMDLLGPLRDVVRLTGLEFRRGFLAECTFKQAPPECAELATLESVELESLSLTPPPSLRNLVEVSGVRFEVLPALAAANPRLRRVFATWVELRAPVSWPPSLGVLDVVDLSLREWSTATQPNLRRLLEQIRARRLALTHATRPFRVVDLLPSLHTGVECFELRLGRFQTTTLWRQGDRWPRLELELEPIRHEAQEVLQMLAAVDGLPPFSQATVRCHPMIIDLISTCVAQVPALAAAKIEARA